jgi:hypothetical protein
MYCIGIYIVLYLSSNTNFYCIEHPIQYNTFQEGKGIDHTHGKILQLGRAINYAKNTLYCIGQ